MAPNPRFISHSSRYSMADRPSPEIYEQLAPVAAELHAGRCSICDERSVSLNDDEICESCLDQDAEMFDDHVGVRQAAIVPDEVRDLWGLRSKVADASDRTGNNPDSMRCDHCGTKWTTNGRMWCDDCIAEREAREGSLHSAGHEDEYPEDDEPEYIPTPLDEANEGVTKCFCGCKYWEYGYCIDCGTPVESIPGYQMAFPYTGSRRVVWTQDGSDITPGAEKAMDIVDGLINWDTGFGMMMSPEFDAVVKDAIAPIAPSLTQADIDCLEDYNYHDVIRALGSRKTALYEVGTPVVNTSSGRSGTIVDVYDDQGQVDYEVEWDEEGEWGRSTTWVDLDEKHWKVGARKTAILKGEYPCRWCGAPCYYADPEHRDEDQRWGWGPCCDFDKHEGEIDAAYGEYIEDMRRFEMGIESSRKTASPVKFPSKCKVCSASIPVGAGDVRKVDGAWYTTCDDHKPAPRSGDTYTPRKVKMTDGYMTIYVEPDDAYDAGRDGFWIVGSKTAAPNEHRASRRTAKINSERHSNGVQELIYDPDSEEDMETLADLPDVCICGECGRAWIDSIITSVTPSPGGRCPFEYEHNEGYYASRKTAWCDEEANLMPRADLRDRRLSGEKLSGIELDLANLDGADLSKADLSGASLKGAILTNANLSGANLTGAELCRSYLYEANLTGANLTNADLYEAQMDEANLTGVNLTNADLRYANLTGVNLTGVNLRGANLRGVDPYELELSGADLSGAVFIASRKTAEFHLTMDDAVEYAAHNPENALCTDIGNHEWEEVSFESSDEWSSSDNYSYSGGHYTTDSGWVVASAEVRCVDCGTQWTVTDEYQPEDDRY